MTRIGNPAPGLTRNSPTLRSQPAYPIDPGYVPLAPRGRAPVAPPQFAPAFDEKGFKAKSDQYANDAYNKWLADKNTDLSAFKPQANNATGAGTPYLTTGISLTKNDGTKVSQTDIHNPNDLNDPAIAGIVRANARAHFNKNVLPQDPQYQAMQAQAAVARGVAGTPIALPLKPSDQIAQERLKIAQAEEGRKILETAGKGVAGAADRLLGTTSGQVAQQRNAANQAAQQARLAQGDQRLQQGQQRIGDAESKAATPKPTKMSDDDKTLFTEDLSEWRKSRDAAKGVGKEFTDKMPLPSQYIGKAASLLPKPAPEAPTPPISSSDIGAADASRVPGQAPNADGSLNAAPATLNSPTGPAMPNYQSGPPASLAPKPPAQISSIPPAPPPPPGATHQRFNPDSGAWEHATITPIASAPAMSSPATPASVQLPTGGNV